jgi:predicted phage tail protein
MTIFLTALALIIALGAYAMAKPRQSTRLGQVLSAGVLLASAFVLGTGASNYSEGRSAVLQLVSGAALMVGGIAILRHNRRYTPLSSKRT